MALQVLIAHTGQILHADPGSFASLDAFRAWVAKHGSITVQNQIHLTENGKGIKQHTLFTEKEIFVFYRQFPGSPQIPLPPKYEVEKPPDTISDTQNLKSWVELFKARRAWSLRLLEDCGEMSRTSQERYQEIDVMSRSFQAAVVNLETHVKSLRAEYAQAQAWVQDLVELDMGKDSDAVLRQLRSISSTPSLIRFITGRDPKKQKATLEDLVDVDKVKEASASMGDALDKLNSYATGLTEDFNHFMSDFDGLLERVENGAAKSALEKSEESNQLMEDIEALVKKVNADYENVLDLPAGQKSLSQASKSALLHTTKHLPTLMKRAYEMEGILRYAFEMRNLAASELIKNIQTVTSLTAALGNVNSQLKTLEIPRESEGAVELLNLTQQLPTTYAGFLAEAIRRREWNEKVRSDSSTLANEMAAFQDEEERRRKRWHKAIGTLFWSNKVESKTMGLEVNLSGEEEIWPQVTRQQLEDVLTTLKVQEAKPEIIDGVSQVIANLNNPTRQQTKRAKAFKAGSLHEAALGRSALLMRGDDELIRSLQDEKARMEARLKGSESRVRRLEDLLHRQGVNRVSTGNTFQLSTDSSNPLASPKLNDDHSRQSSISSPRYSANQSPEDKILAQKLVSLEAELLAEREHAAGLNKEIAARTSATNDIKAQMDDANHTKKDLMENLEAQKREFMDERKSLEDENKRMKAKVEELEDELDRVLGSRDNDKAHGDERVRAMLEEVERLRKETDKAQGLVEFLRDDTKAKNELNTSLEMQLHRAIEDNKSLVARAERAEANQEMMLRSMITVHSLLYPHSEVPEEPETLAESFRNIAKHATDELDTRSHQIAMANSDLETARASVLRLQDEISAIKEKLGAEEMETFQLRETLGAEKAKLEALNVELIDEREQLASLREKFASGETGSEALKSRVAEEEQKVSNMSEELAAKQSQVKSLELELRSNQDKAQNANSDFRMLKKRFEARTLRAKDLTQRLYTQNERMTSLLERLSFSITRQGDSMIVQKIPRSDRTSANDSSDPSTSIRRSISGADTLKKAMLDSTDLELLHWMQTDDFDTESEKYLAFLDTLGKFDIEAFDSAISKQISSLENTARKYRRDARAYREKSHSAQKEAHEKIAMKNFKEGDLALFLPTRGQSSGAWAAFNVGAPHYFLREQDSHKLRTRDWLLARIQKIEDRTVDLSKSMSSLHANAGDGRSIGETSTGSYEDDNPFDLSDGLRWHLIEAVEEKPGAPSTPGQGKSTVASAKIDATGSITKEGNNSTRRTKISRNGGIEGVSKTLTKSLDSRRSSSNSKKAVPVAGSAINRPASLESPADNASISSRERDATQTEAGPSEGPNQEHLNQQLIGGSGSGMGMEVSPTKRSVIMGELWSLDASFESGKVKR